MGVVVLARELAVTLWTKVPGSGCSGPTRGVFREGRDRPYSRVAIIVPCRRGAASTCDGGVLSVDRIGHSIDFGRSGLATPPALLNRR